MTTISKIETVNHICAIYCVKVAEFTEYGIYSDWQRLYSTGGSAQYNEENERTIAGMLYKANLKTSFTGEDEDTSSKIAELLEGDYIIKIEYINSMYRIMGSVNLPIRFDYKKAESPTKHYLTATRNSNEISKIVLFPYEIYSFYQAHEPGIGNDIYIETSSIVNFKIDQELILNDNYIQLSTSESDYWLHLYVKATNVTEIKFQNMGFESVDLRSFINVDDTITIRQCAYLTSIILGKIDVAYLYLRDNSLSELRINKPQDGTLFELRDQNNSSVLSTDNLLYNLVRDKHVNGILYMSNNALPSSSENLEILFSRGFDCGISAVFTPINRLILGGGYLFSTEFLFYITTINIGVEFEMVFSSDIVKLEISATEIRFTVNELTETVSYASHDYSRRYTIKNGILKINYATISDLSAATPADIFSITFGQSNVIMKSITNGSWFIITQPNGWFFEKTSKMDVYSNDNMLEKLQFNWS